MSHFTTIQTHLKDMEALRDACAELHLELHANTTARGFEGTARRGEYVIKLPGPYDIALHREPDGTYALSADLWDGSVEHTVGKSYSRLVQLYGVHKATREARKRGHTVVRRTMPSGAIKLTFGGM
jgi:hypothetical protein